MFRALPVIVALLTLAVGWRARSGAWPARVAAALACGAAVTGAAHLRMRALGEPALGLTALLAASRGRP